MTNKEKAIEKYYQCQLVEELKSILGLIWPLTDLRDLKLQRKHIILLTDGQSATQNEYEELIQEGLTNNITLSTVAIGQDSDRNLLEQLADIRNGTFL